MIFLGIKQWNQPTQNVLSGKIKRRHSKKERQKESQYWRYIYRWFWSSWYIYICMCAWMVWTELTVMGMDVLIIGIYCSKLMRRKMKRNAIFSDLFRSWILIHIKIYQNHSQIYHKNLESENIIPVITYWIERAQRENMRWRVQGEHIWWLFKAAPKTFSGILLSKSLND